MKRISDIPDEVWKVWVIQARRQPIGSDLMNEVNDIVERYPKYFQWEHKYNSIPQEVHDAFQRECYPEKFKPLEFGNTEDENAGLDWIIKNHSKDFSPSKKLPSKQDLLDFWKKLESDKMERLKRQAEIKRIWDKHYSKYKLDCREF